MSIDFGLEALLPKKTQAPIVNVTALNEVVLDLDVALETLCTELSNAKHVSFCTDFITGIRTGLTECKEEDLSLLSFAKGSLEKLEIDVTTIETAINGINSCLENSASTEALSLSEIASVTTAVTTLSSYLGSWLNEVDVETMTDEVKDAEKVLTIPSCTDTKQKLEAYVTVLGHVQACSLELTDDVRTALTETVEVVTATSVTTLAAAEWTKASVTDVHAQIVTLEGQLKLITASVEDSKKEGAEVVKMKSEDQFLVKQVMSVVGKDVKRLTSTVSTIVAQFVK